MQRSARPWLAAMAAVVLGVSADAAPTGLDLADAVQRAVLAVVVVLAAGATPRAVLLVVSAVVASAAGGDDHAQLAAVGACVVAAAGCVPADRRSDLGWATGLLLFWAMLHLDWPDADRATAGIAALVTVAVVVGAVAGLAPRWRRASIGAAAALLVACVAATAAYAVAARGARAEVGLIVDTIELALDAARDGRSDEAAQHLALARGSLGRLDAKLDRWWARPARVVPVVGLQANAVDVLLARARALSVAAHDAVVAVDPDELRPFGGRVDLDLVESLAPSLDRLDEALVATGIGIGDARSPWLVAPIDEELDRLDDRVSEAQAQIAAARRAVAFVPELLGRSGPRTWFLALVTPSELRGSGGFPGNYAILTTRGGVIDLEHVGRIDEIVTAIASAGVPVLGGAEYLERYGEIFGLDRFFQNVTASPHFPSVADSIARTYEAAAGRHVDGVLSLDPYAFEALLSLTGPISVSTWPEPISAGNVVQILLYDQYVLLPQDQRIDLLSDATQALFTKLVDGGLPAPADTARVLAEAVDRKHLQLWSADPGELGWFHQLAADGAMRSLRGDGFGIVVNNASESKIDWFLHREVQYDVTVDPVDGDVEAIAEVTFRNDAPTGGLPAYVIGPAGPSSEPAGHNRMFVSVFTALELERVTVDGVEVSNLPGVERGRNTYDLFVTVPPGGEVTMRVELAGHVPLPGGAYVLDVHHQPGVRDDRFGYRVDAGDGPPVVEAAAVIDRDRTIRVDAPADR